ncbi:hypothetical protein JMJ55_23565 [Belnapia sp. T6]|uniref:Uncharacterized protein n=1 Tax=Belnapia mucosa TaxID=2804532 RepID=A0ABS1V9K7_9PROT|nr:hypothetical protein [Belnapia mucosa]MBL6458322.1 hypothetical protein [Belnapia mucosa]
MDPIRQAQRALARAKIAAARCREALEQARDTLVQSRTNAERLRAATVERTERCQALMAAAEAREVAHRRRDRHLPSHR